MADRIEQLDGLRGLAIILVVLCHATMAFGEIGDQGFFGFLIPLGGSGVNLFFVLSGFLISGLLLDGRNKSRFLRHFYARRSIRIVPAFYFCLLIYAFVLPAILPDGNGFSGDWLEKPWVHFSFLSNFFYFFKGAFGSEAMSVSWSLAIEEQFYLVWPMIFCFLPRKSLLPVCGLLIVVANVIRWRMISSGYNIDQIMVFTPARLDSFAMGGVLALCWRDERYWVKLAGLFPKVLILSGVLAAVLQLMISVSSSAQWVVLGPASLFVGTLFFVALIGVALDGYKESANCASGVIAKTLSDFFCLSYLRKAGALSYSVYLTHLGIIYGLVLLGFNPAAYLGDTGGILVFYIVAIVASFIVGWALYRLVEAPTLRLKNRF